MRVLYVDDDRINTLLFVETCRFAGGVEVETAGTGAEALERALQWSPDLLVLDLHLPDTTGYALLPQLRAALGLATLPAILCTADAATLVETQAKDAGFEACWTKPVDLKTVLAVLQKSRTVVELDSAVQGSAS
jgi:two-component system, OmpR family, response regulator